MYQYVKTYTENGAGYIILNDPKKLNALSLSLIHILISQKHFLYHALWMRTLFPAFRLSNKGFSSIVHGTRNVFGKLRNISPLSASTLITVAPQSANILPQEPAATIVESSNTLTPSNCLLYTSRCV